MATGLSVRASIILALYHVGLASLLWTPRALASTFRFTPFTSEPAIVPLRRSDGLKGVWKDDTNTLNP
jgi:hypothetical protein